MQASENPSSASYVPGSTTAEPSTDEQYSRLRRLSAAAGIVLLLPVVGIALLIFSTGQGDQSTS